MTLADKIVVLDHGDIQQVGSPMELYERPANLLRRPVHRLAQDERADGHAPPATASPSPGTTASSRCRRAPAGLVEDRRAARRTSPSSPAARATSAAPSTWSSGSARTPSPMSRSNGVGNLTVRIVGNAASMARRPKGGPRPSIPSDCISSPPTAGRFRRPGGGRRPIRRATAADESLLSRRHDHALARLRLRRDADRSAGVAAERSGIGEAPSPERGSPAFWWGRASPTRSGFLARRGMARPLPCRTTVPPRGCWSPRLAQPRPWRCGDNPR